MTALLQCRKLAIVLLCADDVGVPHDFHRNVLGRADTAAVNRAERPLRRDHRVGAEARGRGLKLGVSESPEPSRRGRRRQYERRIRI